jgi:hypothetical protein
MTIKLHDIEQGTDEWLELRKDLYTGSGADKLLKHSGQFKIADGIATPYALAEITGFKGNFFTRRGHILEDQAIELYQRIKKCEVERAGFVTNSKYPTCGYSPDGLREDRTLECKAFNPDLHMKMFKGDIPVKVLAQCHFGMLICGKKLCDLIIYNPDLEAREAFKVIPIRYNPKIAANFKRILSPQKVAS